MLPAFAALTAYGASTGFSITNLSPVSNLLPPGTSSVTVSFTTSSATTCGWSMDPSAALANMTPFEQQPVTAHQGPVTGLSTDTRVVNTVYIQCAADSTYSQSVQYRDVPARDGSYPRIGSIWSGGYVYDTVPAQAEKIQLFCGPFIDTDGAWTIRNAEPSVIILPSFNATSQTDPTQVLPEDYYLLDVNGNKIQNWPTPGSYLLNLTKPEVANFLANEAYQYLAQNGLAYDGIFWDNVFLSISWYTTDVFGNPVQIDANGDGIPDNPATLDAAWRAGVYLEMQTFRQLAPSAYMSGHLGQVPPDLGELPVFNGDSLVFDAVNVQEGVMSFDALWDTYNDWFSAGRAPAITMVQSSPPNQISYGYGFTPNQTMLPSVLQFGQTWYPNVRFGLALALMNDGFFTYDMGDAGGAVAWWYDEYGFPLGVPLAPAARLSSGGGSNLVPNGGFEQGIGNWYLWVDTDGQAAATDTIDNAIVAEGADSIRIDVTSAATADWHINLSEGNLPFIAGTNYQLQFWARASVPAAMSVDTEGGAPNYPNYGLWTELSLSTTWQLFTIPFLAPTTANDGTIQFNVGEQAASVWIDGVQITALPPDIYARDYTQGKVLLNGTTTPQTIAPGAGFQRFTGTQAPRYQYIVDDSSAAFSATGDWYTVTYNSGGGTAGGETVNGPYYHAWGTTCHELDYGSGDALWNLGITQDGTYTLETWLPAAPGASGWTHDAIYEVLANGQVIFSATLDQTSAAAGDQWHMLAPSLNLTAASSPTLRVHNGASSGSLIADAVYVYSAALYNDGSAANSVTLAPMDGILLQRTQPLAAPASRVTSVADAASFSPATTPAGWVSIFGAGFSNTTQTWTAENFVNGQLPTSLGGVSVSIDGQPAYISYVGPQQINALVPADSTIGSVSVQVQTPQGASYPGTIMLQRLAPELFAWAPGGVNYAAAEHADGTVISPQQPVHAGEVIELYGTGFGPTSPPIPVSQAAFQPAVLAQPATASIGGMPATVTWAGLIAPGLYQVNVQVPSVAAGDQPVVLSVAGFASAGGVYLPVAAN
ncbi:MAG: putative glycoside hydrolase [Bryobacteraceae bacterium]